MIRFACPSCHMSLAAPEERAGAQTTCPRCRQPLQVPAPEVLAPAPVLAEPVSGKPWWKKALAEVTSVCGATAGQTGRLLSYGWSGVQGRRLQRRAAASQMALGRQAFTAQAGDAPLRQQVAETERQMREAAGARPRQLAGQRDQLLLRLAEPLLQGPALPAVEPAWRAAHADRAALEQHRQKGHGLRAGLWPAGLAGWLRVTAGYSVAMAALLLVCLLVFKRSDGTIPDARSFADRSTPGSGSSTEGSTPQPRSFTDVVDAPAATPTIRATGETLVVTEQPRVMVDSEGHTAPVSRVAFTPDGRYVISASFDKTVRIWDLATSETVRVIRLWIGDDNDGAVLGVAASPDGKTFAVGGKNHVDGKTSPNSIVFLIDLATGKIKHALKGHQDIAGALAFSPDGKRLASGGGDRRLILWDVATGKSEKVLEPHSAVLKHVSFSPDGERILVCAEDSSCYIWSVAKGVLESRFTGNPPIQCNAWSPDGKSIAAGHGPGLISITEPGGKLLKRFVGVRCDRFTSVSFTPDGKQLLFTGFCFAGAGEGLRPGCGMLDLSNGDERIGTPFHYGTVLHGALSPDGKLAVTCGARLNEVLVWRVADSWLATKCFGKGRPTHHIAWTADGRSIACGGLDPVDSKRPDYLHRTFNLTTLQFGPPPDGNVATGQMRLGNRLLVVTPQGHLTVVDAASNAVLRTYKPELAQDKVLKCAWLPDGRVVISVTFRKFLWDPERNRIVREFTGTMGSLAWTEEGVYAASPGGEQLIGWHVNNAPDQAANFYPAAQFRRSLYQPDVIRQVLPAGSVSGAFQRANKPYTGGLNVLSVLPPAVAITSPVGLGSIPLDQGRFTVKASARSVGQHPVTRVQLLVDGRPYGGQTGARVLAQPQLGEVQLSWEVDLPPGIHLLSVLAENAVSRSVAPAVEVTVAGKSAGLPNLYILAVGINDYPGELKLNYAAPDADAIVAAFQQQQGKVFGKIEAKLIKDKEATRQGIEQGLSWLGEKMTSRDVGLVSFSGHGDRDEQGMFYLIPVDVNIRNISGSCVSGDFLKKRLAAMPGRLLTVLDACHSGAAGAAQRRAGMTDDLVRDLISDDYGIVVLSSSRGDEYSLESPEVQHGFFTLALTEALQLQGKSDVNKDGYVYLNDLDFYTMKRVRELSGNRQTPVMSKPRTIHSFALGKP